MKWSHLGLVVFAVAVACRGNVTAPVPEEGTHPVADVTAKVAQAAAAMTGQQAKFANDYEKGHFVGFDTNVYPGTETMRIWKNTPGSPYSWVGFYLPSPCHPNDSWIGKRDTLSKMGWGIAMVYVGQQTWGKTPQDIGSAARSSLKVKKKCATNLISEEEGIANADDATRIAQQEGLAPGSVVFLDIERMENIPSAMKDYYRGWTRRMLQLGVYQPGYYTHEHNAQEIHDDVAPDFRAAGNKEEPRFWVAGGRGFDEGKAPQEVGYGFAGMWQGVLDVARSVANVRLPVDVNVAHWASPSESGTARQAPGH